MWESSAGFQTHTHYLTTNEFEYLKGFAKRGMVFARKFSVQKNAELLNMIDSYIHFNESTDAGLMWPGFYDVDITSPGPKWKAWLMNHRKKMRQDRLAQQPSPSSSIPTKNAGEFIRKPGAKSGHGYKHGPKYGPKHSPNEPNSNLLPKVISHRRVNRGKHALKLLFPEDE
jgi:hypothetical protein